MDDRRVLQLDVDMLTNNCHNERTHTTTVAASSQLSSQLTAHSSQLVPHSSQLSHTTQQQHTHSIAHKNARKNETGNGNYGITSIFDFTVCAKICFCPTIFDTSSSTFYYLFVIFYLFFNYSRSIYYGTVCN